MGNFEVTLTVKPGKFSILRNFLFGTGIGSEKHFNNTSMALTAANEVIFTQMSEKAPRDRGRLQQMLEQMSRDRPPIRAFKSGSQTYSFAMVWDFKRFRLNEIGPGSYVIPVSTGFGPSGSWNELPNLRRLSGWVRRKFKIRDPKKIHRIALGIAKKIMASGIKPQRFLEAGVIRMKKIMRTQVGHAIVIDMAGSSTAVPGVSNRQGVKNLMRIKDLGKKQSGASQSVPRPPKTEKEFWKGRMRGSSTGQSLGTE